MDNFELIAFVIGILYFLFGSSKKKKERPKPHHQAPKRPDTSPSLEDILRELTGQKTEPLPPPAPVQAPEIRSAPKQEPKIPEYVPFEDTVVHHAETGRPISEIRAEISRVKGLEQETPAIEFDLRQAVINDAILRRPYGDPLP